MAAIVVATASFARMIDLLWFAHSNRIGCVPDATARIVPKAHVLHRSEIHGQHERCSDPSNARLPLCDLCASLLGGGREKTEQRCICGGSAHAGVAARPGNTSSSGKARWRQPSQAPISAMAHHTVTTRRTAAPPVLATRPPNSSRARRTYQIWTRPMTTSTMSTSTTSPKPPLGP